MIAGASASIARLGRVTSVLVGVQAGLGLFRLVPGAREGFVSATSAGVGPMLMALAVVGFFTLLGFVAPIAFVLWVRRATKNLRLIQPDELLFYTPGAWIGWWFVPLANLILPFNVMRQIWHHSDPVAVRHEKNRDTAGGVLGWRAPPLVAAWWVTWVACVIVHAIAFTLEREPLWRSLGAALVLCAGVLCMLVIREVTARQRESLALRSGAPGITSAVAHVVGRPDDALLR